MPEPGDQTEAELERTRRVVAEQMAAQIAANDAAAHGDVAEPESDLEPVEVDDKPKAKPAASKSKGT